MIRKHQHIFGFKGLLAPLVALTLLTYFVYHLIQGERGLLSWHHLSKKVDMLQDRLNALQSEKQVLERQVTLLSPSSLCPDLLEERVRQVLNFARSDEVIIFEEQRSKS